MSQNQLIESSSQKFVATTLGSEAFEVIPLAGDASSRRYYRIVHDGQTLVLMVWEPFVDDGHYPFLNVLSHFQKHKVQVPEVIAKAPHLGLVLLEDLGDLTLERKFWENQNQSLALPYYKQAIDELIKIHYPASLDSKSDCVAFKVSFNTEKLLWEMNYGFEHLIQKFCQVQLSDKATSDVKEIFLDICRTLDAEEKLICHRDYHSRNVMLKLNRARVIDFQDARMGTAQYDLVSLLHDSYVDLNDNTRSEILEYYFSRAKEYRKGPWDRNHFFSIFRIQMIQRCFKACGSFASFFNMREDKRYLKYLKPTVIKVATTLEQYPQYSTFLNVIRDHGLLEFNYMNPTSAGPK